MCGGGNRQSYSYPKNASIFKGTSSSVCKSSKGELYNNLKTLKGREVTQWWRNLCKGQVLCDLKVLQSRNHLQPCKFSGCMGNHWVRILPWYVIFKVTVRVRFQKCIAFQEGGRVKSHYWQYAFKALWSGQRRCKRFLGLVPNAYVSVRKAPRNISFSFYASFLAHKIYLGITDKYANEYWPW